MVLFHGGMFGNITDDMYRHVHELTDTCVICQELVMPYDEAITLECTGIQRENRADGHSFHLDCMTSYANVHGLQNIGCPMCRRQLNQDEVALLQSVITPVGMVRSHGFNPHTGVLLTNLDYERLTHHVSELLQEQMFPGGGVHPGQIQEGVLICIHQELYQEFKDTWVHNFMYNEAFVNRIPNVFIITEVTRQGGLELSAVFPYLEDGAEISEAEPMNWSIDINDLFHIIEDLD
tara:strand:+ start:322 stop:1026 length:705 start_codon:yes stop_codon:yes gene_type:complete